MTVPQPSQRVSIAPLACVVLLLGSCVGVADYDVDSDEEEETIDVHDMSTGVLPVADATVRQQLPLENDGSQTSVRALRSRIEAHLRFLVPDGAPITKATLRMYVSAGSVDAADVFVAESTDWSESEVNWNTRPAAAALLTAIGVAAPRKWIDVDVTSLVRRGASFGLVFRGRSNDGVSFASRESSAPPRLLLETSGAGTDAGSDAGTDAGFDAGTDAGLDAGSDAGLDAGSDAGLDAGTDAGLDAGTDAGVDAGTDAGLDAGRDAGTDAGVDAGIPPGCVHFHPGHYFRETDSATRNIDGIANTTFDLTNNLASYADFVGIVLQIDWAMLEPTRGNYNFSRVDTIMNLAQSRGKVVRLKIMDRSFWAYCNPTIPLVPAYANQYPHIGGGVGCFADTWTRATMDGFIALHIAAARRYNNHPAFAGFSTEETAISVANAIANSPAEYNERVRLARELFAAVPEAIFISEFNWPMNNDLTVFTDMIDQSAVVGVGGLRNAMGVSWPDSYLNVSAYPLADQAFYVSQIGCTQSVASNGRVPCNWYNLARQYNTRTIVAPNLEGGVVTGTLAEAEALYRMMDDDLHAHMLTWDNWTAVQPSYVRVIAAPTIRNHGGRLRNSACPFTGR